MECCDTYPHSYLRWGIQRISTIISMKHKAELSEIVTEYTKCIQSSAFGRKEDVLTPRGRHSRICGA